MPEEYGDLGLIVPTSDDYNPGQADVPRAFRAYTDSLNPVASNLQAAGGNGQHLYTTAAVTRASGVTGPFSTPYKITLPRVAAGQLIEVWVVGWFKNSLESVGDLSGSGGMIALNMNGHQEPTTNLAELNPEGKLAANLWEAIATSSVGFEYMKTAVGASGLLGRAGLVGFTASTAMHPQLWLAEEDATNFTIELVGKSTSGGTITGQNVWLAAAARF